MKNHTRLILLLLAGLLAVPAFAQNRLYTHTPTSTVAADDKVYLDGPTNGTRALAPDWWATQDLAFNFTGNLASVIGLRGHALPSLSAGFLRYNGSAWVFDSTPLVNPMTTLGDVIVGGSAGLPVRLGIGGNGTFIGVSGGVIGYFTPAGGGNVSTGGSPSSGQAAEWTSSTVVTGVAVVGTGSYVKGTAPTIVGGSVTALTALGIRDTSAAFDVTLAATSSTTLTAGRTLTIDVVNAARTLKLTGNAVLNQDLTTGASPSFATVTAALAGNATSATTLATARNINGVPFDGSGNITIAAAAGTLTGATLASNVLASSMTSTGTLTGGATGAGFTVALGTSTITGVLGVVNGGAGAATFTAHGVLLGQGASAFAATAAGTAGAPFLSGGASADGAYGALNLAGGSSIITGLLPSANIAAALSGKTYEGLTITTSTGILTIANGKTMAFNNTLTFTGTDSSSVAFGAGGTVLYNGGPGGTPSALTLTNATGLPAASILSGALANGMLATTQSAGDSASNPTKLATDLYADRATYATHLGTFASPDTAAGAITWVSPMLNIFTSASGATRTYTLPAAASFSGQGVIINVVVGTNHVNVQPASGAQLVLAGTLLAANHYVQAATSAAGNYICYISDGTNWSSVGSSGTWTDSASP